MARLMRSRELTMSGVKTAMDCNMPRGGYTFDLTGAVQTLRGAIQTNMSAKH